MGTSPSRMRDDVPMRRLVSYLEIPVNNHVMTHPGTYTRVGVTVICTGHNFVVRGSTPGFGVLGHFSIDGNTPKGWVEVRLSDSNNANVFEVIARAPLEVLNHPTTLMALNEFHITQGDIIEVFVDSKQKGDSSSYFYLVCEQLVPAGM